MPELAPGSEFAGYRIEGVAGRGGMGIVYRARQRRPNRKVALKVVAPELADDDEFRRRFERESDLAAQIEHPNVLPIYDADEADGALFITMRFVEGEDLGSLVEREGRLEPRRAARIVGQIGQALDAAHRRGLVHRDVKPGNVLIVSGGVSEHVYLADFGLTKLVSSESTITASGAFVGTADYVAPEQLQGGPLDARADVYALGCVLFFTLTACVPYPRQSQLATMFAHANQPPPSAVELAPELPATIQAVIERAMAKDPRGRFPSAGDLGRAALASAERSVPLAAEQSVARGKAAASGERAALGEERPGAPPREDLPTVETGRVAQSGEPPVRSSADAPAGTVFEPVRGRREGSEGAPSATADIRRDRAEATRRRDAPPDEPRLEPSQDARKARVSRRPSKKRPRAGLILGVAVGVVLTLALLAATRNLSYRPADEQKEARAPQPIVGAPIRVGEGAAGIAVGKGAVWVPNKDAGTVSRIDSASGKVVGKPIRVGAYPRGVAVGARRVWVVNAKSDTVSRIAPAKGGAVGKPIRVGSVPRAVAVGAGVVWVANAESGTVSRIDSASGRVVGKPIRVGAAPLGVAVGDRAVWVANAESGTVSRLDPGSGRLVGAPIGVGAYPRGVAVGAGAVWVANAGSGTVSRIDPASGTVVGDPIRVGAKPVAVAVGEGAVWVANATDGTVSRIDPSSGRVVGDPVRVGAYPRGVAVGAGAVWVANAKSATVSRIDP